MFEKNCQSFIFNNNKYVLDNNGELKQILVDCSRSGRENPHSNNKRMTNYLSHVYHYISDHTQNNKFLDHSCDLFRMNKKSNKLSYCSRYLEFGHTEDTKRLTYIESCHSSLCPSCNFFRARLNLSSFVAILSDFFNSEFRSLPFLLPVFKIKAEYLIRSIFFKIEKISNKEDKTRFTKKKSQLLVSRCYIAWRYVFS